MTRTILLVDAIDSQLTSETTEVCEGIFEEYGFSMDDVQYAHLTHKSQVGRLPYADVIVAMGAEAVSVLLPEAPPLKKVAGALTYHKELGTWVLPTNTPNVLYMPEGKGFNQFDIFYDHLRRAIDMCQGTLAFPDPAGVQMDWVFVGHNGEGWNPDDTKSDRKIWTGYFECTPEEEQQARVYLTDWLTRMDSKVLRFGADTESFNLDHLQPLTMIQVHDAEKNVAVAFTWGVIEKMLDLWFQFFNHPNGRYDWHNIKHDAKMIRQWLGVRVDTRHNDTLAWSLGLTEKGNQTGLKYMSRQYCNAPFYEEGLERWLGPDKKTWNFGHIRPDVLAEYGCYDVFFTSGLAELLPPLVEREGTTWPVENILLPGQRTFGDSIEFHGIRIDQEFVAELKAEWEPMIEAAIKDVQDFARDMGFPYDQGVVKNQIVRGTCSCVPEHLRAELEEVKLASRGKYLRETYGINPPCNECGKRRYTRTIDDTLNVHSPVQMQHLCFDVLGMDETYEGRKTNKYFWQLNPSHQLTKLVKEYRQLDYLNTNIITGFSRFIRADGRVHPSFWLSGTVTGRLSASEPAVHGIPKHGDAPKRLRKAFLPDSGDVLVDVDYSNLELYMAQHLTGDAALLEGLQKDLHRMTAAAMYMCAYEEVSDVQRQSAKPVVFGSGYNIGPAKLSRDINLIKITEGKKDKAQEFLDAFWVKYHVWDAGRKQWMEDAVENCELRTELGRVRRWNLITRDNLWKVHNQACNFLGQSMASDLCLTSVIRLQRELENRGWGRVLLTVHDSIVFSLHKENVHEAVRLIREIMTSPVFETTTPFKVDVQIGLNYGDVVEYDTEENYAKW